MKEYPIYKKRDGQSFKYESCIYSDSFKNAKKEFAKNISKSLQNECWLTYLNEDDIKNPGFYVNDSLEWNNECININESHLECFLTQKNIDNGFDSFNEDVYTWELRKK